jgi:hypothetical protein
MISRDFRLFFIKFLLILAVFVSCGKQQAEWKGTIEELDGITIVNNPKTPIYSGDVFSLEQELSIYGIRPSDGKTIEIDVDESENIYIYNPMSDVIEIYNKEGEYLRMIEGKEFKLLMSNKFQLTPQKEVMGCHVRSIYLAFFSLEGTFLRKISFKNDVKILKIRKTPRGNYIGIEETNKGWELVLYDPDLQPALSIFLAQGATISSLESNKPPIAFSMTEDKIVWGYKPEYEIQIITLDGKTIKRIKKDHDKAKVSNEVLVRHQQKERMWKEQERIWKENNVLPNGRMSNWLDHYPAYTNIFIDEQGRIFVEVFIKRDFDSVYETTLDIFDQQGRYIARGSLPNIVIKQVWKNGKLYTVERIKDEPWDIFSIRRYKVSWKSI